MSHFQRSWECFQKGLGGDGAEKQAAVFHPLAVVTTFIAFLFMRIALRPTAIAIPRPPNIAKVIDNPQ